jgi:hypothetical protein
MYSPGEPIIPQTILPKASPMQHRTSGEFLSLLTLLQRAFLIVERGPLEVNVHFYEKVLIKADVAASLFFLFFVGFATFPLGSLSSDDWQPGGPTAPPLCLLPMVCDSQNDCGAAVAGDVARS